MNFDGAALQSLVFVLVVASAPGSLECDQAAHHLFVAVLNFLTLVLALSILATVQNSAALLVHEVCHSFSLNSFFFFTLSLLSLHLFLLKNLELP